MNAVFSRLVDLTAPVQNVSHIKKNYSIHSSNGSFGRSPLDVTNQCVTYDSCMLAAHDSSSVASLGIT